MKKRTYRFSDPACKEDLVIRLDPRDWYDADDPEIGDEEVTALLDWWSDPHGRGYLEMEDGYGIIVVDASSGEPDINVWSHSMSDETYELEYFPFSSLSYYLEGTNK